jgi:hypothetical protein
MSVKDSGGWGPFIEWAARFYEMAAFDAEEREYKFRAIEPLARAKGLVRFSVATRTTSPFTGSG